MKILRVGDPHIKVNNIVEGNKLIDFIIETAKKENVDRIEFLGDLFHTHAVKRLEVEHFWCEALDKIEKFYCVDTILLVGNHDQIGTKEQEQEINSLRVLERPSNNIYIVNKPFKYETIAYMPYMSDQDKFIEEANKLYDRGAKLLVCHQTFQGATYENGFYAPEGIELDKLKFSQVISGHIHKQQQVGKCFYPGTPKWDTVSDANEDKGIWVFTHNPGGTIKSKKFFSTAKIVTPIYKFIVNEGEELPKLAKNARNHVELVGSSAWIKQISKKIKNKASIKSKPTDRKVNKVNLDSITWNDHLKDFDNIPEVTKDQINHYIEGLNG
jgi:DNA repair exonuclease SbcCD nuclease subunit